MLGRRLLNNFVLVFSDVHARKRDRSSPNRTETEQRLHPLLQLLDQDPDHGDLPLCQSDLLQRMHLQGNPALGQDPTVHEVHAEPEGGDQVRQRRGESL